MNSSNKHKSVVLILLTIQVLCCVTYIFLREEQEHIIRRRRNTTFFIHQMITNASSYLKQTRRGIKKTRRPKRWWVKKRSNDWWERIVQEHFTEEDWLSNFRITRATFSFICKRLRPYLQATENYVREPLSVEKKVAIALYKLASCAEYRVVANQFGTHKCIVHKCVYAFCEAVNEEFKSEYLTMPNDMEAQDVSRSFENMCGIPNVVGTIDGTHVPILPPREGYRDFVNRKGWPSYNLLAVVDSSYRFRYATCKHPGSSHDAKVLKDSNLFENPGKILPKQNKTINGQIIPSIILGDPAYPLLPWLLKPYKGNLSPEEESFNVYLSRGRVVVENAFGRLKARFRCLLKRTDINYKFVPKVVFTCLILHNIVECRKDKFVEGWKEALKEAEIQFAQPPKVRTREFDNLDGAVIRNTLKNYMLKYPLRRSMLV